MWTHVLNLSWAAVFIEYMINSLPIIPTIVKTKSLWTSGIQIIIMTQNPDKLETADHLLPIMSNPQIDNKSEGHSKNE